MPALPNNWLHSSIIYQLFVGRWLSASLISHPGKVFNRLASTDFSPLLENGINCIYLLGVFDNTGPIIVSQEQGVDLSTSSQRLPSVFALTNHQNTNPLLGSLLELKDLISTLQSRGLRVITDFVPNHTSTVHPWLKTHPEYYSKDSEGFVAEFSGDVYKLNYQNPELFQEMFQVLKFISDLGVDGVRVDMAHLIPEEFWKYAIKTIKQKLPDFVFLAEAYPDSPFDLSPLHSLLNTGFDSIYNGHLYHNLKNVLETSSLTGLVAHTNHTHSAFKTGTLLNYFTNHDDDQPESAQQYLEALSSLILYLPGVPLIFNGSLKGKIKRLAHHTFDQLLDHQTEIHHFPDLAPLFKFREEFLPIIVSLENHDLLLTGQLTTQAGNMTYLVNFSPNQINLEFKNQSPGYIRGTSPKGVLPSGKIEIFKN